MTTQSPATRRRWTDAERARLLELARSATPVPAIAATLGRSTSAVHQQLSVIRAQHTDVPRRAAPPWTDEQDAELLRAIGAGETAADVAPQLGRGPRAARARLRYLTGPTRQPTAWTEQEDAQLTAGYEQGATYAELAEQLDRPPSAIAARIESLRRRGEPLAPRRPRWTDERRRKLAQRRRDGATLRQLEHEFSISRGTLTSQLRTLRRLGYDLGT